MYLTRNSIHDWPSVYPLASLRYIVITIPPANAWSISYLEAIHDENFVRDDNDKMT